MAKPASKRNDGLRRGEGTIVERGGRFQARWLERQPDGSTKRSARSFPTRDDAEDFLRKRFRDRRDGRYKEPFDRTVADTIAAWMERGIGDNRWKGSTIALYRQLARLHVVPELGAIRISALTTSRIQHWIDGLRRTGLNPSTVDAAARVLGGALREAKRLGEIADNPYVGTRRPTITMKTATTWTTEEVAAVERDLADKPMWLALYRVMLTTGMRPGEARALTWQDIDVQRGVIVVRRTISEGPNRGEAMGDSTKTGKPRAVPLTAAAARALQAWRKVQVERQLAAEPGWNAGGFVFTSYRGSWLRRTSWYDFHIALCQRAGVRCVTRHELRHTNATHDLEAGTHPLIVSTRLGHTSVQITLDRYSHVSVDLMKAAADALDRRLFGEAEKEETGS